MEIRTKALNERGVKTFVILFLVAASAGLAAFFHLRLNTDILYTHFFYIPIVLTSMWWGRRGIWVGFALAAIVIFFHLAGLETTGIANDLVRTGFFLLISFFVGALRGPGDRKREGVPRVGKEIPGSHREIHRRDLCIQRRPHPLRERPDGRDGGVRPRRARGDADERARARAGPAEGEESLHEARERRRAAAPGTSAASSAKGARPSGSTWRALSRSSRGKQAFLMNLYNITEGKEAAEKHRELTELAREEGGPARPLHQARRAG